MDHIQLVDGSTIIAPPALPEWIREELTSVLNAVGTRSQISPSWLPDRVRALIVSKRWGEYGEPLLVTQENINAFAQAVNDFQDIHVNPAAALSGPFQGIVAHGDFTTSLDTHLIPEFALLLRHANVTRFNKYARLTRPVRPGNEVGMRMRVISCHAASARGGGAEIFYEYQAMQMDLQKLVAIGFGTIICTQK